MKQKRAEKIAQYGLIVAQCLFIIFILVGLAFIETRIYSCED